MIDCVFLMLIYFMTTSSLEQSEADLSCPVGGVAMASDPLPAVDEQSLRIAADGTVNWNASLFNLNDQTGQEQLAARLTAFKETCEHAGSEPSLRVLPEAAVPHQVLVWLLDSISHSGIEQMHFP